MNVRVVLIAVQKISKFFTIVADEIVGSLLTYSISGATAIYCGESFSCRDVSAYSMSGAGCTKFYLPLFSLLSLALSISKLY